MNRAGEATDGCWWRRVPDWLWPPRCLACGGRGRDGRDLCAGCDAELPRLGLVPGPPPPFACVCAAFHYRAPVDRWLRRLKFHGDLAAGRLLSALLAEAAAGAPRPEALVPLPLHRRRLRERGFDQALELARPLARALALPLRADALVRVRATQAQTELGGRARRRNVLGAFAGRGTPLPAHVALVDDVMTTGATLAEAAKTLHEAGVQRVDAWVVALADQEPRRVSF